MQELETKLKRRGSKDLSKKLESGKCSVDEKHIIAAILIKRGVIKEEKPKAVKPKEVSKKSSNNITCDFLKIGQKVKFIAKSKDENNGKEIEGTVVKIYDCKRNKKPYVRLKADGHTYHKRLNVFE
ncbi:MAG: hypothetical protein ACFFKA_00235 [Candidatus Thorarchaeota archaeon]